MFKHEPEYADLSADLRDRSDFNVAALRSFEYPLNVATLAVEPITGLLAIGTATGTILILGGASVESKLTLPERVKVKFLQFSGSTFQLVCLDERSQLHIFDLSSFGRPKLVASARYDQATSLTLSPSHSHAFIALESGEIRTYDMLCLRKSSYKIPNLWHLYEEKTMAIGMDMPPPTSQLPIETVVHPRDLNLLFVAYSGGIILSDLTQRNTLRAYEFVLPAGAPGGAGYGHPDILTHRRPAVTAIAIHPAGHFFAVGYSDGCIAFWAVDDEDQPLLVRTLDTIDVNLVNVDELEKDHDIPPPEREPIYKLAWSSFSNSSDPRGGETALTILGGLIMANNEATGLNVQWLPAFNPAEPPSPAGTQTSLHPFMRSAMKTSIVPLSDFFYLTPGIPQDFFLTPRNSPHFAGHHDPTAILVLIELANNSRIVEAYQFPPPAFLAASEPEASAQDPQSESLVDELALTLKALTVTDDPRVLRLPTPLSFSTFGIFAAQLLTLDRDSHELFVNSGKAPPADLSALPLKGGAAWSDESKAREIRLAKFQMPRILMTHHHNAAAALQFHDISAQLLITSDSTPIENHFPNPLPGLTIDLRTLLTDAAVVKRTSPSFLAHAIVQSAYLARQSLECAVQFASGELVVYRLKSDPANAPRFTETHDDELVPLEHVLSSDDARFSPYFLLTTGKPVSACAISDIGFLAVAYTDHLIVVDMRGPRVILRRGRDKKNNRISVHLHTSEANSIMSLTWTVTTTEHDPQIRTRLIVGYTSGLTEILTVIRETNSPGWRIDADIKKIETVAHPLVGGTFILDPKKGLPLRATKELLAQSFHPTPPETHCILITAGAKGARSFSDITGPRIGKTDWGNKTGTVQSVQIVEKMGSRALIAITDNHEVLAFSIPQLEYLCTLRLPTDDTSSLTCDETGDWMTAQIIDRASYGTIFDFRRAYTPPNITFTQPTIPSQPQPVSLGPTSLLSSWFRFGQSMTGEQLDILLGGPDRPIPEAKQSSLANFPTNASSAAQIATEAQSSLYARLQSAVGERGQMLGDLEDHFNSLEQGSRSMVTQAKRMAAEQSAKSWFGF
ncbi:WD40 containing snare-dependent exocytosis protein [Mycena belliarum]|uniref:WD40 containing snare-dependent exocytosis protein n=1 Tax=Mycena belliarum TaxID=1033014 RepID=A0AAD6Y1L9_9AGAR|nr:WD40 containing snare-dependent exocytosis protein [Mycena belliae]